MKWWCIWHILGEKGTTYQSLVEKPEEGRTLGRPRHRWEDNIKMDFKQFKLYVL
jgi:hypothetical protein